MAVRLAKGVEKLIDRGAGLFMKEVVATERGLAPVDTGNLAGSITGRKVALGSYIVTTSAIGRNGVAYPLHIEFGEETHATNGYPMHFIYHGQDVYAWSTAPSSKNHFAKKTISAYGGKYWGK